MELWLQGTVIGISEKEHRTDKIGETLKKSWWGNSQELKIVNLKLKRSKSEK